MKRKSGSPDTDRRIKRKPGSQMIVVSDPKRIRGWKSKARASGMSMKQWVEHTLDAGPVLTTTVQPRVIA